jgi:hypothetical protein
MDWLEHSLKTALGRRDPPEDFAARVIRQAAQGGGRRSPVRPWPGWMAAAAAVLVLAGTGLGYRQHRGTVAKEKVMLALRITSVKVNRIQGHVREAAR